MPTERPDSRRMPALDGIRAFAVLAVITYHTGVHWMQGGFYGVDVFLVLSGFLITSLLVGEWGRSGTVSLSGFWVRRARRLLPALFLMLAGVALVAGLWPAVLSAPHLMSDAVATILYVANWHLAGEHASYFAAVNQPSPLLHTWTLAIEEQFYLVWPLVVVVVMGRARRRTAAGGDPAEGSRGGLRRLLAVACAGAAASAVWMIVLAPTDGSDPSRAYYGSDTRAQGLLVGAALAVGCALWGPVRTRAGARVTAGVGVLGAAGVALMWMLVPETDGFAFHGGFLLVTLACGAVVVAAARVPRSAVGRVLSLRPLRYLGQISYGMYLWYWPVLLVMTGARTHLHGYALTVARLAVVTGVASLSFHLVETPVRRGALAGWRGALAAPAAAMAAAGAVLAATTLPALGTTALAAASGSGVSAPEAVSVLVAASSPAAGGTGSLPSGPAPAAPVSPGSAPTVATTGSRAGQRSAPAGTQATAHAPGRPDTSLAAAAPAAGGRPVRILLVGDSMAGSLGVGLADVAPDYGAEVVNAGMPGCSLASDQQDRVLWYTLPPGQPCVAGRPQALLSAWADLVARTRPDVVVYLARSDILDTQHDGQWGHIGQDGFDQWLSGRLAAAVPVLGSGGAPVVLLTSPTYQTGEQSSGDVWPEDDPARVSADTSILRSVQGVTVLDAGAALTPSGDYRPAADGVTLRCSDGVHLTRSGGQWLGARILPELVALGRSHAALPGATTRPPAPTATPSWWSKLPCNV
ncbi:MAG TPA: acyltransferase family protein [Acidimicrobiales bacterium]|nr:acyltransferase family protein [Acidimicrobiales bacterium]